MSPDCPVMHGRGCVPEKKAHRITHRDHQDRELRDSDPISRRTAYELENQPMGSSLFLSFLWLRDHCMSQFEGLQRFPQEKLLEAP